MEDQRSDRQIAEEWLQFTLENWKKNINALKVKDTTYLYNSFKSQVIDQAGGDKFKIRISYAYYGAYVDMGVGRGMPVGSAKELGDKFGKYRDGNGRLHRHVRKPKKWLSRNAASLNYQVFRLSVLLAEKKSKETIKAISDNIYQTFEIKF